MYHLMLSCLSLALTWFRYHPGCISPVPSVVHLSHCPHCVWIVMCVSDRALRVIGFLCIIGVDLYGRRGDRVYPPQVVAELSCDWGWRESDTERCRSLGDEVE